MKHFFMIISALAFSTFLMGIDGCSKKDEAPTQMEEAAPEATEEPTMDDASMEEGSSAMMDTHDEDDGGAEEEPAE